MIELNTTSFMVGFITGLCVAIIGFYAIKMKKPKPVTILLDKIKELNEEDYNISKKRYRLHKDISEFFIKIKEVSG